jgi:hypothetical protein
MISKMHKTLIASAIAALAAFHGQMASAAEAGDFSFTTGLDYSSGKYGGAQSTDILYIPFIGKYETGPWSFKLTVPYIRITGPGGVVRDVGAFGTAGAARTTESGLGDVIAAATYNIYGSTGINPLLIDLTGKVKFGTADANKGLGTGENDYAIQADLYKSIDKFTTFGTVGYKVFGDPVGINLDNVFYGSLGGSYKYNQQTSAGLILDLRQKASATGASQRELTAFVSHKINKTWKAQGYLVHGFADGSPDWGAGAMVSYFF